MSGMSGNTTGIKAPFPLPSTLSLPPHYPLPDLLRPQHAGRQRSEKAYSKKRRAASAGWWPLSGSLPNRRQTSVSGSGCQSTASEAISGFISSFIGKPGFSCRFSPCREVGNHRIQFGEPKTNLLEERGIVPHEDKPGMLFP